MINSNYIFKGKDNAPKIIGFVRHYFASAYESSYKDGFIRVIEDNSYFKKTSHVILIRFDSSEIEQGSFKVEVIVAGSGSDQVFDIWDNEGKWDKSFARSLQDFCKREQIDYDSV